MFRRVALTLLVLAGAAGAVLACNPVSVGYSRVAVGRAYTAVSYAPTVSVVSPYVPTVTLQAQYAQPVAAAPCVCEQPPVAAPAAYEAPVAAPTVSYAPPVAAPMAAYAQPVAAPMVYARVAAPVYASVGYAPTVAVGTGYTSVRLAHVARVNVAAVRVGVANTRRGAEVTVVRANQRHRLGLRERIQIKRTAVRAARAAR